MNEHAKIRMLKFNHEIGKLSDQLCNLYCLANAIKIQESAA